MEKYDYLKAVTKDVKKAILNNYMYQPNEDEDKYEYIERICDDLTFEDSVTGNNRGWYTSNESEALKWVTDNLDLYAEMLESFGEDEGFLSFCEDMCRNDVKLRIYVLYMAIQNAVEELNLFKE